MRCDRLFGIPDGHARVYFFQEGTFQHHIGKEIMEQSALLNERLILYGEVIDILAKRGRIEISSEDYARLKPFFTPEIARNQRSTMMSAIKALGAFVYEVKSN
jgi:hypothetical protein